MDDQQETIVQEQSGDESTTGAEGTTENVEVDASGEGKKKGEEQDAKYNELLKRIESAEKANQAFQREKDLSIKENRELKRRNKSLEDTLKNVRGRFGDDPDVASTFDNELNQGELNYFRNKEAEEKAARQRQIEHQQWVADTKELLEEMGVDPSNPKLANATAGATSYTQATKMLLAKAKEINGGKGSVTKDAIAQIKEELLATIRKEQGLDSEDNIPPTGSNGSKDIKSLLQKYSEGDDLSPSEEKKVKEHLANLR